MPDETMTGTLSPTKATAKGPADYVIIFFCVAAMLFVTLANTSLGGETLILVFAIAVLAFVFPMCRLAEVRYMSTFWRKPRTQPQK